MGKRRNAAKTGDKNLKRLNVPHGSDAGKSTVQDVDDFHKDREESFLALDDNHRQDLDADELMEHKQSVLDLGVGEDSSDEESDDSSSAAEEDVAEGLERSAPADLDASSENDSDSDDDDERDLGAVDPRQWGRKKSAYYDGDLADLELGVQEEDDAFVEEEAAREIMTSRLDQMDEDDFIQSDDEDVADHPSSQQEQGKTMRNVTGLSSKERKKLLKVQHPECVPVASHFSKVLKGFVHVTKKATEALTSSQDNGHTARSVGATKQGQQFLLTKSLIEQSAALNTLLYLLTKYSLSEQGDAPSSIDAHPVMLQLTRLNTIMDTLSNSVVQDGNLLEQVEMVGQASRLLAHTIDYDTQDSILSEGNVAQDIMVSSKEITTDRGSSKTEISPSASLQDRNERDIVETAFVPEQLALGEARFGLRQHEVKLENTRKRRIVSELSDFGREPEEAQGTSKLTSVINAIDQRAAKRKAKFQQQQEGLDYPDDDEVVAGLSMMEEEFGKQDESGGLVSGDVDLDDERDQDNDEMGFYDLMARSSKQKKQTRKEMHQVAPKYPNLEVEVQGERAITRAILKNRGLVPHKNRINRNPRVKKRMQYQKALVRRKGAVRELRSDEGHYDGEGTGIKSRISRSRKIHS